MRLSVSLVSGFLYAANVHECPLDIELSTDVPVEIYSRVVVTGVFLSRIDDAATCLGYSQRVLPAKRAGMTRASGDPGGSQVDAFEHEDDFADYRPGHYLCEVSVLVGERVGEGVRHVDVRGAVELLVV